MSKALKHLADKFRTLHVQDSRKVDPAQEKHFVAASSVFKLPVEIHELIRDRLRPKDILSLMLTCKVLHGVHKEYFHANVTFRTSLALLSAIEAAEAANLFISSSIEPGASKNSTVDVATLRKHQDCIDRMARIKTLTIKPCYTHTDLHDRCKKKMLELCKQMTRGKEHFFPDLIERALPFLPSLESLFMHEFQYWFTERSARQLGTLTPKLKRMHLYTLHTEPPAMITVLEQLPGLEELHVGNMVALGGPQAEKIDPFIAKDLATAIIKHPSLKTFGTNHYGKGEQQINLESVMMNTWACQSYQSNKAGTWNGIKLESFSIQDSDFNKDLLADFLLTPASMNIKHLSVRYDYFHGEQIIDDTFWDDILQHLSSDYVCFLNANTDVHLEGGPVFFFADLVPKIQHRISKITIWCPIKDHSLLHALIDNPLPRLKEILILGTSEAQEEKEFKLLLQACKPSVILREVLLDEHFYEDNHVKPRWMLQEEIARYNATWHSPCCIVQCNMGNAMGYSSGFNQ